ncbi:MAG: hypothetical protein H0X29_06355, partial [Parachlamydiaceae bacterium]|nr:hypothetical protein [Parachlamydiaceae bacterium]
DAVVALNNYKTSLIKQVEALIKEAKSSIGRFERTSSRMLDAKALIVLLDTALSKIINLQMGKKCLPDKMQQQPISSAEVQRQMQQQVEQNQAVEQNRETAIERNLQNMKFSDNVDHVKEASLSIQDPFNLMIPLFDGRNTPQIFSIKEKLKKEEGQDLISEDILLSQNFLRTQLNAGEGLLNATQKGIVDLLVIEERGKVQVMILSSKESAFFSKKIAEQRTDETGSSRNLWLMNPHGSVVQSGPIPWQKFPDINGSKKHVERLLLQTLFLSGDIFRINQQLPALSEWIHEKALSTEDIKKRKEHFSILLTKAIANSLIDQGKLKLSYELRALLT